jgi:hypothetical protein
MDMEIAFNLVALAVVTGIIYLGYRLIKGDSDD